ncbi:hypothetical protein [Thalassorhabdomicrobium marinisediminis]|uniref:DUF3102 domain-containing protein n=1 Tax=Thalassorhabdomicrobium marinisediminis TaxID=2170577 RepID=A0A2T7FVB7_9RHOB|nr:hypothetical protein [Thalassorhabdomicrobium marinisediminis]PVA06105.1 hypothetical protein DC363_12395 [Thalassorhabdomicrobium marinisediminis]
MPQANQNESPTISPELRSKCDEAVAAIRKCQVKSLDSLIGIGTILNAFKKKLPHAYYLNWVENEISLAPRTAQRYRLLAENLAGSNATRVSHLPLRLIYKIAALETSERDEVLAMITNPEKPPRNEIEAHLDALKEAKKKAKAQERADKAEENQPTPEQLAKQEERREAERAKLQAAKRKRIKDVEECLKSLDSFAVDTLKDLLRSSGPEAFGEAFQTALGIKDDAAPDEAPDREAEELELELVVEELDLSEAAQHP